MVLPQAVEFSNTFLKSDAKVSVIEEYEKYAPTYDKTFTEDVYKAPYLVANAAARYIDDEDKDSALVMDIAAGTGIAGEYLKKMGFKHLAALDPSTQMLSQLLKKGIYERIIKDTIGDHEIDVKDGFYDAIVMSGGFVSGHVPNEALDEMIRIVKKGGYIIVSMRYEYLHIVKQYMTLEEYMRNLQKKGLWRMVEMKINSNYFYEKEGITFVFQKI